MVCELSEQPLGPVPRLIATSSHLGDGHSGRASTYELDHAVDVAQTVLTRPTSSSTLSLGLRSLSLTRPNGWNRSKVAVLANQDRSVTSGMVRGFSSGTWTGWVDGA